MNPVNLSKARRRRASYRPTFELLEDRLAPATYAEGFLESVRANGIMNPANPTTMEIAPDGRIWALRQTGGVEVFRAGSTTGWNALTIPASAIASNGERGLLGIAFDPNYDINSGAPDFVYLYYTSTTPAIHNRVSRFTVNNTNPDQPTLGSESVILELDPIAATSHNGGAIHFGPDGKLYVAVGDNGNADNAQSLGNRFGKILRINADGSIPADNPTTFAGISGAPAGNNRAIWAVGLRNPFTFAFQPGTGRMFINDVGQVTWEEINEGTAGANYGWPTTEGDFNQAQFPAFTRPVYAYSHGNGTFQGFAITGGAFYNPANPDVTAFPSSFTGDYFFADFVNRWINVLDLSTLQVSRFATNTTGALDIDIGPDGSLYYLAIGDGRLYRVVYDAIGRPEALTPAGTITTDLPTFTWTAVPGAVRYDVWVDNRTTGRVAVLRNQNAAGTSWTPDASLALSPGHSYRWWVGAVSAGGTTVWSAAQTFVIAPLGAPTPTAPGGTIMTVQPTFTWTAVPGADHYDVWVDDLTTGRERVLRNRNAAGTSWTPDASTPLIAGHSYRWWVGAVSRNGTTTWSNDLNFAVARAGEPAPQSPSGTITTDLPTFTWTGVPGVTTYDIWVDDRTTGRWAVLRNPSATGTSWTPDASMALSPGHSYRWWVGAVTPGAATVWSNGLNFNIAPLGTPTAVSPAGTITTVTPTFTWTTVAGAARYDIWVDDQTTGRWEILRNQNATGTSWTPDASMALALGHHYRWWVGAVSNNGTTRWSFGQSFFIAALPAPALTAPSGPGQALQPTFTWTAVAGAARYDIWVDDLTTGREQVLRNRNATTTSWTADFPLRSGRTYRWWVRAFTANNESGEWSTPLDFSVA